jgi:hypothetical protein
MTFRNGLVFRAIDSDPVNRRISEFCLRRGLSRHTQVTAGGWLIMNHALRGLRLCTSFRCGAACKAGIMVRGQRPPAGTKSFLNSLSHETGARGSADDDWNTLHFMNDVLDEFYYSRGVAAANIIRPGGMDRPGRERPGTLLTRVAPYIKPC